MMSYLFVIPLYALVLAAALVTGIVCLLFDKARHLSLYFFVGALGSVPGVLIANLFLFLVLATLVKSNPSLPGSLKLSTAFFVQIGAIIGPVVASAVGAVLGAGWACALVRKARIKKQESALSRQSAA